MTRCCGHCRSSSATPILFGGTCTRCRLIDLPTMRRVSPRWRWVRPGAKPCLLYAVDVWNAFQCLHCTAPTSKHNGYKYEELSHSSLCKSGVPTGHWAQGFALRWGKERIRHRRR
jgi:hypothetical protein